MSTATPSSRHIVERHLRILRRGGGGSLPGNEYYASSTFVGHGLAGARNKKRKRRSNSNNHLGDDNNLDEHRRAEVSEHVPCDYTGTVRVDAASRRIADPMREYYDAKVINPWTMSERILFLKLFVFIGKEFAKIASHLTFKSTHDVARFYYEQKLTFRLKEMRARFVAGEVITDDDIIRLGRTGTMSANMSWNFVEQREEQCQGTVNEITGVSSQRDETTTVDRLAVRKESAENGDDREHLENVSLLSNTNFVLATELHVVGSAAAPATKADMVQPFTPKLETLKQH